MMVFKKLLGNDLNLTISLVLKGLPWPTPRRLGLGSSSGSLLPTSTEPGLIQQNSSSGPRLHIIPGASATSTCFYHFQNKDFDVVKRKLNFIEKSSSPGCWREESQRNDIKKDECTIEDENSEGELRDLDEEELLTEVFTGR